MIWLAITVLAAIAWLVTVPPLLRKAAHAPTRAASDLAVYRAQLLEIDTDLARGTISSAEAEAARIEIKRRILALPQEVTQAPAASASPALAISVGVGVAASALALYLALGQPSLPSRFYNANAERAQENEQLVQQVDAMVAKIAARVQAEPNDPKAWRMLGWTYLQIDRVKDGVDALARAVELDPKDSTLHAQYGEALIRLAGGTVTPKAVAVFDETLKLDPKDPRARFYKGLALAQAGKEREALDAWIALIREAPKDAEWLPTIRTQARELATKLKLDPKLIP